MILRKGMAFLVLVICASALPTWAADRADRPRGLGDSTHPRSVPGAGTSGTSCADSGCMDEALRGVQACRFSSVRDTALKLAERRTRR